MRVPGFKTAAGLAIVFFLMMDQPGLLFAKGVKTYYKQYSVYTYQSQDYLCEPYTVQKNDWLYKIFRTKGEISTQDFPLFLSIFKKINPRLNNIDAISPGIRILIPLKKIEGQAFRQDEAGNVEVPVVEFTDIPENYDLTPHTQEYTIQSGDTVSNLLDKAFLKKGGGITKEGKTAFSRLNPEIDNIHLVYPGTRVVLPSPSILSQPWFQAFLAHGTAYVSNGPAPKPPPEKPLKILPVIHEYEMLQLKRYASLIKGTLINQGKLYFPGKGGRPDTTLDLARTPVIETDSPPQKIILLPRDEAGDILEKELLQNIKSYWKQLKIEQIDAAVQAARQLEKREDPAVLKPAALKKRIAKIVSFTPFGYSEDETIGFQVGTLAMTAKLGRIQKPEGPDLLINFGTVYGMGLDAISDMGFQVFSIPTEGMTLPAVTVELLEKLGYTTWKNPAFTHGGIVETLEGIYAVKNGQRLLIFWHPLSPAAVSFLDEEDIQYKRLQ